MCKGLPWVGPYTFNVHRHPFITRGDRVLLNNPKLDPYDFLKFLIYPFNYHIMVGINTDISRNPQAFPYHFLSS